jgi:hypothetical protein
MVTYDVEPDGSWTARTTLGELRTDASGKVDGIINDVRAIALDDVTSLTAHLIDESPGAVNRWMTCRNGCWCRLTYCKTGEVIEFVAGKVRLRVIDNRVLTINPAGSGGSALASEVALPEQSCRGLAHAGVSEAVPHS